MMRIKAIVALGVVLGLLWFGTSHAQVQPNGIPAPAGFQWVVSYDEEFTNESSINSNVWNQAGGYSLSALNGVAIQGSPSNLGDGYMVNSNDSITQRYGAWEWLAKFPHNDSGEANGYHSDLYLGDSAAQFSQQYIEDDVCEWDTVFTPQVACQNAINDSGTGTRGTQTFLTHVPNNGSGSPPIGDAFHTWGMYWANDGTAHGTVSDYFDGVQQTNTIWSLTNPRWDQGARPLIINHDCGTGKCSSSGNNPLFVKYFRVWHLVPTSATSTPTATSTVVPTPTPTPTPPPTGCTPLITSPQAGQTVSGTLAVTGTDTGCPGPGWNRIWWPKGLSDSGTIDTTQVPDGTMGIEIQWMYGSCGGAPCVGGTSAIVNVNVSNHATPTPTPIPTSTPTPPPTPTPTPTPSGCHVSLSMPSNVTSPVTFTPTVSGCAGWPGTQGFVRAEQTQPFPIHHDGAAGTTSTTVSLGAGSYTYYVTLWLNSVTQIGGSSNLVTFTVGAAPTSTPTPTPVLTASFVDNTPNGTAPTCNSQAGTLNVHIKLTGMSEAVTPSSVTVVGAGVAADKWVAPCDGVDPVPVVQTTGTTADLWFSFVQHAASYQVTFKYPDGSTQTSDPPIVDPLGARCDKISPIPGIRDYWTKACGMVAKACAHPKDAAAQQGYLMTPKGNYFIRWCSDENIEDCIWCGSPT